jgi:hypothetical protein
MQKKLTITLDEAVYEGLHQVIGRRRISRFITWYEQTSMPPIVKWPRTKFERPRHTSGPRPP